MFGHFATLCMKGLSLSYLGMRGKYKWKIIDYPDEQLDFRLFTARIPLKYWK